MEEFNLNLPMSYSLELVSIIVEIMIVLMFILIFYLYYWDIILNYYNRPNVKKAKRIYLKKLNNLSNEVNRGNNDYRNLYFKLSKIIREFIKKAIAINVVSLSKYEIKKLEINDLDKLMEEYYPPEFSMESEGDIKESIERTINLIKKWE